jgi:hypothetical protein
LATGSSLPWRGRRQTHRGADPTKVGADRIVKTEHEPAAEAKVREWLERTLPKKFGVTSGYVIPNLMAPEFKLEHFDIIIHDALDAPVLWVDENDATKIRLSASRPVVP